MNQTGTSLIEVTVAMAILALGTLAVTTLLTTAVRINSVAGAETQAALWAQNAMERLLGLAYDHPDLDSGGNPHTDNNPPSGFEIAWEITDGIDPSHPAADVKAVAVTVSWQARGEGRNCVIRGVKIRCY